MKFGALRDPEMGWNGYDSRPVAVKNFLTYSLRRLGVDHIDIYRPARLDPSVPIEDTVGAMADMVKAGLISNRGLEIKVLGTGKVTKALHVQAHRFSATAKAAIEAAGGKAEVI